MFKKAQIKEFDRKNKQLALRVIKEECYKIVNKVTQFVVFIRCSDCGTVLNKHVWSSRH